MLVVLVKLLFLLLIKAKNNLLNLEEQTKHKLSWGFYNEFENYINKQK